MRTRTLPLLVLALVGWSGCSGDAPRKGDQRAAPRDAAVRSLHVVGNQLVGPDGRPVRLLGVNRSGAEYSCVAPPDQHLGIFAGPTGEQAVAAMASWRINAVRIPLNEHCWLGIQGAPVHYTSAHYRSAIQAYVARLERAGFYVVLDLHWNAPGTQQATEQQPMADLDYAPAFWSSVARTFKDDMGVVFDLYNEPYDIDWRCWRDGCTLPDGWRAAGMQALVDAVRSTGARQPVIATGTNWGSDLSAWLRYRPHDPAGQTVAGAHVFDFSFCPQADCWTRSFEPVARAVPVVVTELGQRDCSDDFIERFMGWADAASISYLGWGWNPAGCTAPSLIQSWDGQPTPSGARFRAHLARTQVPPKGGKLPRGAVTGRVSPG
jgi:endoglucanase